MKKKRFFRSSVVLQGGNMESTGATGKVKMQEPAIVVEVFCLQARNLPQIETVHFV
jgi:hypothetical protein